MAAAHGPPAAMDTTTVAEPALQEVADGVFAYLQPDGGWCLNNAGVIAGGGTAVLVDTAATQSRARRLRDTVATIAVPDLLINTHHHGDHVFGNALFAPPATIVAQELTRAEMIEAGFGLRKLWPAVDWGDLPLVLPTLTFRDALTIHVGDLRLEVQHVGPAHTTNDVVVWVPDRGVLFAGDVVMAGATPFCLMGSVEGSLRAIERLRELGAQTIVAGHGPVSGPEIFDVNESYLRWVLRLATEGVRVGRTPLQAARGADLGEFAQLLDAERLAGNLYRAYQELGGAAPGAPVDVLAGFQEMVAYHGRLPDCHA
jgi:cyclase